MLAAERMVGDDLGRSAAAAALTSKGACVALVSGRYDEALSSTSAVASSKEADLISEDRRGWATLLQH